MKNCITFLTILENRDTKIVARKSCTIEKKSCDRARKSCTKIVHENRARFKS